MSEAFDFRQVGGVPVEGAGTFYGEATGWDFGWIPPDRRDPERAAEIDAATLPFTIQGKSVLTAQSYALLWECWKDSRVLQSVGGVYPGIHQITGSCVGAGGGNAIFALSAVEVVRLGDAEQVLIPFWPLTYGKSRQYAGLRGRGEGSFAGAFGKAASTDGIMPANLDGLPAFTRDDGLTWGRNVELEWSDGSQIATRWLERSRKHLVKSVAQIKSADQCREALANGYPVMFCGDWGGLMQCPTQGEPAVLMNRRSGQWMHNQTALGWWDHPTEGEIFCILNQWGLNAHGTCPSGAPAGSYWIKKAEMEYQCRNGECLALSQFQGFPAADYQIPWVF